MELDYGQIVTQILGFILVLWIMKRFAWKPLLRILQERSERVKSELGEAEKQRLDMQKLRQEYEEKLREIDAEARARLQEAVKNAQRIASEIKEDARGDVKEMLGRARDEIERDRAEALVQLRNEVVDIALRASEKVLRESMDTARHRKMVAEFIRDLDSVDA
ncbi:MAG: F0F1 ATP synthase subunit B [Candidatus Eiseniibacteriota bacterium]|nr:MAG: F0F1 ATP synthase subunit B [Candidatus Eisenbacteria bacterium]